MSTWARSQFPLKKVISGSPTNVEAGVGGHGSPPPPLSNNQPPSNSQTTGQTPANGQQGLSDISQIHAPSNDQPPSGGQISSNVQPSSTNTIVRIAPSMPQIQVHAGHPAPPQATATSPQTGGTPRCPSTSSSASVPISSSRQLPESWPSSWSTRRATFPFPVISKPASPLTQESATPVPTADQQASPQEAPAPTSTQPLSQPDPYDGDEDVRFPASPNSRRKSKTARENVIHSLVRKFLKHKGIINSGTRMDLPAGPSPTDIAAYLGVRHTGPTLECLQIAWDEKLSHPWNKRAIQVLASAFPDYAMEKHLPELFALVENTTGPLLPGLEQINKKLKEINIEMLIQDKISQRRSEMRAGLRKITVMTDASMTPSEIEANLEARKLMDKQHDRRAERKKLRFVRRDEIIQEMIKKPLVIAEPDRLALWSELESFFTTFCHQDMSSDDTETEATFDRAKTVRRVRKYWIDPSVSDVFHFIDRHYSPITLSGSHKRGSAPLPRLLESHEVNATAKPRSKLPKNIYSNEIDPATRLVLFPGPEIHIPDIHAMDTS